MTYTHLSRAIPCGTALVLTSLLAACGGGGSDATPTASVSDITTSAPLTFSKTATFTIKGSGLDSGNINLNAAGCKTLTLVPGGTATQKQVTCTVAVAGTLKMDAQASSGTTLLSRSFSVPTPQVSLQTTLGTFTLELAADKAPNTALNFLNYVNSGFYAGTLFHRVIPGFVVQGGGFTSGLVPKATNAAIALETSANSLSNLRGTVAMARTSEANSATSQFYINLVDNTALDYQSASAPGYAVFGHVKVGMDVIDNLAKVPTNSAASGLKDVPVTEVQILSAVQTQ